MREFTYSSVVQRIKDKREALGITLDPRNYLPVIREELKLKRL